MKPKECVKSNCTNIFYVEYHKFFQRDLCDKCTEIFKNNLTTTT